MTKKYNHTKMANYKSYKIGDICSLYKKQSLHEDTIRAWINEGTLPAFRRGNVFYIYGGWFKQFLIDRKNQTRRKLCFNELKCWSCKMVAVPLNNILETLDYGHNNNIGATANCQACGRTMYRSYKPDDVPEVLKIFIVKQNNLTRLSDTSPSISKTDINNPKKARLYRSGKSKTDPPLNHTDINEEKTVPSIKEAGKKFEQLNLFNHFN